MYILYSENPKNYKKNIYNYYKLYSECIFAMRTNIRDYIIELSKNKDENIIYINGNLSNEINNFPNNTYFVKNDGNMHYIYHKNISLDKGWFYNENKIETELINIFSIIDLASFFIENTTSTSSELSTSSTSSSYSLPSPSSMEKITSEKNIVHGNHVKYINELNNNIKNIKLKKIEIDEKKPTKTYSPLHLELLEFFNKNN